MKGKSLPSVPGQKIFLSWRCESSLCGKDVGSVPLRSGGGLQNFKILNNCRAKYKSCLVSIRKRRNVGLRTAYNRCLELKPLVLLFASQFWRACQDLLNSAKVKHSWRLMCQKLSCSHLLVPTYPQSLPLLSASEGPDEGHRDV